MSTLTGMYKPGPVSIGSGAPIAGVHQHETNLTPNSAIGSIGYSKVQMDGYAAPQSVRIPVDWHKNIVR